MEGFKSSAASSSRNARIPLHQIVCYLTIFPLAYYNLLPSCVFYINTYRRGVPAWKNIGQES